MLFQIIIIYSNLNIKTIRKKENQSESKMKLLTNLYSNKSLNNSSK